MPRSFSVLVLTSSSYTCGAIWRTCACTEADQARREREIRTRLAEFEDVQRAEEEEARAAAAAVEAAERQLREEREAEEARIEQGERELARMESERVQQIANYFVYLRGVMERVMTHQKMAIEKRHHNGWAKIDSMRDELDSQERIDNRDAHVKSERDKIIASTNSTIKALQCQHAASIMEMISRHRKDQDELFARATGNDDPDAEIHKAETIQELLRIQDLERATLASEQAREIQKWKSRGQTSLQAFDSRMIASKMRLEEAEEINKRETEVRKMIFADSKWTETLFEKRFAMLVEDERKMIANGGEAPEVPKQEKAVVIPGKESPTVQVQIPQERELRTVPQPPPSRMAPTPPSKQSVRDPSDKPLHFRRTNDMWWKRTDEKSRMKTGNEPTYNWQPAVRVS